MQGRSKIKLKVDFLILVVRKETLDDGNRRQKPRIKENCANFFLFLIM